MRGQSQHFLTSRPLVLSALALPLISLGSLHTPVDESSPAKVSSEAQLILLTLCILFLFFLRDFLIGPTTTAEHLFFCPLYMTHMCPPHIPKSINHIREFSSLSALNMRYFTSL